MLTLLLQLFCFNADESELDRRDLFTFVFFLLLACFPNIKEKLESVPMILTDCGDFFD